MGLLSIVPWYVRAGVIVALPLAGFATGWWKAAAHYHLEAEVSAAAEQKASLTAQLQESQRHALLLQQSQNRAAILAANLDASRTLSSGLGVRLQAAIRAASRSTACPSSGNVERSDGSSQFIEELSRRSQSLYDAAGRCGAQEAALMSKPLCECLK